MKSIKKLNAKAIQNTKQIKGGEGIDYENVSSNQTNKASKIDLNP